MSGFFSQNFRIGKGLAMLHNKYPNRLPWGLNKEINTWLVLLLMAFKAIRFSVIGRYSKDNNTTADYYLDFLRRFAVRIGYISERIKL